MKMKSAARFAAPASLLACLASACGDAQATEDYRGEALLTLEGSIVTTNGAKLDGDVVPAVAWSIDEALPESDFDPFEVVDVSVEGEFPSSFRLSMHEPPPASATFQLLPARPAEPEVAFGLIVALPEKHDARVFLGTDSRGPVERDCDEESGICTEKETVCDYYDACFVRTSECTDGDCEVVEETGSQRLRDGLGVLEGIVENFGVVYLEEPAKDGSLIAWMLGADSLEAGYHLVRIEALTEEEQEAAEECLERVYEETDRRFEEAFDTTYEDIESAPADQRQKLEDEYDAIEAEVERDLCTPEQANEARIEVVEAGFDERIPMRLGDELSTVF